MKKRQFPFLIYFIILTVITIICIQVYWNIKNYNLTRDRMISDLQITLDNAVDKYFIELAVMKINYRLENNPENSNLISQYFGNSKKNKVVQAKYFRIKNANQIKKIIIDTEKSISIIKKTNKENDTVKNQPFFVNLIDSKKLQNQPNFIFNDNIDFKKISSDITDALKKKGFDDDFQLSFIRYKKQIYFFDNLPKKNTNSKKDFQCVIESKSSNMFSNLDIKIYKSNLDVLVLKESLLSIFLSFLLSLSIIFCLFYLLKIINKQKQIAEIKNDFISNISHELKTPIAIVSSAIEGIEKFNIENNLEKTKKYLTISNYELNKLNVMVEKILETASLESKELQLKKEKVDLVDLIQKCVEKEQISTSKEIKFINNSEISFAIIDVFHFENVISNCIENAIKYGGNKIEIELNTFKKSTEIEIRDNGNGINKTHQKKIFDKFYRIPTQNIHDIKGFGIGLYYVQQIIEKHLGTVDFIPNEDWTIFKITLPND
jgi:signal transduction histidine kinase